MFNTVPENLFNNSNTCISLETENSQLKQENQHLKAKLKELHGHANSILRILTELNITNENIQLDLNVDQSRSQSKNPYLDYENRPVISRLNNNNFDSNFQDKNQQKSTWDWENRPIRSAIKNPTSILISRYNNSEGSFFNHESRRRSKSVCFAERNSINDFLSNSDQMDGNSKETNEVINQIDKIQLDQEEKANAGKENRASRKKASKPVKEKERKKLFNLGSSDSDSEESKPSSQQAVLTNSENIPKDTDKAKVIAKQIGNVFETLGLSKCNCSGDCLTNRCSCKKSGSSCSSKCHGGNTGSTCKNGKC